MSTHEVSRRQTAPAGDTKAPQALPPAIVQAWEKAGAKAGWVPPGQGSLFFTARAMGVPGDLPAFSLKGWKAGELAKLPQPGTTYSTIIVREDRQRCKRPFRARRSSWATTSTPIRSFRPNT